MLLLRFIFDLYLVCWLFFNTFKLHSYLFHTLEEGVAWGYSQSPEDVHDVSDAMLFDFDDTDSQLCSPQDDFENDIDITLLRFDDGLNTSVDSSFTRLILLAVQNSLPKHYVNSTIREYRQARGYRNQIGRGRFDSPAGGEVRPRQSDTRTGNSQAVGPDIADPHQANQPTEGSIGNVSDSEGYIQIEHPGDSENSDSEETDHIRLEVPSDDEAVEHNTIDGDDSPGRDRPITDFYDVTCTFINTFKY
ncbi:unnamed protein product [Owenia fusiformis]|uniref:Uncharacterized protein n=1 Tax=Owenia fusiformis TaxID=6347 RepID=A0A8S4NPZ0_OWEFU|nr:unnamed protein product [Owenia fusiformis]